MTTTVAAFQPDAPDAPGFQLAEFGGFQTQAVEIEAPPPSGIGGALDFPRRRGRRYRAACALLLVVDLDVVARFSDAIGRDDDDVLALLVANSPSREDSRRAIDRDDEDLVVLVAAGAPNHGRPRAIKTATVGRRFLPADWLALEEDDA